MSNLNEKLIAVVEELNEATSFEELQSIDGVINEVAEDLAATDEYRAAFDAAEARLNQPTLDPQVQVQDELPDDVEQLKVMVRQLRQTSYGFVRDHVKAKRELVRAGVSFRVLRRDVHFTQPQAEVVAQAIIATGKSELTESEVFSLVWKLRNAGVLGGHQSPVRIFRYYMAEGTIGYKVRGFLQKLG